MVGLQKALLKEKTAQKRFNIVKNIFFVYLLVVTLFSAVQTVIISQQLTASLETNRKNGAANHLRTQEYVKCIAITLLKPIAQRTTVDFDNCTEQAAQKSSAVDKPTTNDTQRNAVTGREQPVQQAPQIIIRDKNSNEATGAAPPDPKTPTPPRLDPAEQSRVLTILDDILREVDDSRVGGTLNQLGL